MHGHEFKRDRSLLDRMISGGQSALRTLTDRPRLFFARSTSEPLEKPGFVSVVIPTFNRKETLLERALPSILNQIYGRFHIIIMCHGCTDGTSKAVKEFIKHKQWLQSRTIIVDIPRTKIYPPTPENHWLIGPTEPLNAAFKYCVGDWIARIDDDDEWTPDHLTNLVRFANEGNYEFVSSYHLNEDKLSCPYHMPDGIRIGGCQTWLYRSYLKFMRYNRHSWRKDWNRNNDTDLQDRMWRAGVRMGYLNEVTCIIRPRPGESKIGLAAYLDNADNVATRFAFKG